MSDRQGETGCLLVMTTCADEAEAARIGEILVREKLAACVTALAGALSIFRWQSKTETARETVLLAKTTGERFPALRDRVAEIHSYEVPEIIALPIADGSRAYLEWVRENSGPGPAPEKAGG